MIERRGIFCKTKLLARNLSVAINKSQKSRESEPEFPRYSWWSNKLHDTYLVLDLEDAIELSPLLKETAIVSALTALVDEGVASASEVLEISNALNLKSNQIVKMAELIPETLLISSRDINWLIGNAYRARAFGDYTENPPLTKEQIAARRIATGARIVQTAMVMIAGINDTLGLSSEQANGAIAAFSDLISLLNAGALNTSRVMINAIYVSYPAYKAPFDYALAEIASFEAIYGL